METISSRAIKTIKPRPAAFSTPFISVGNDSVEFPNGVTGEYAVVSNTQPCGTLIIPLLARRGVGYLGLVEQYRYPVGEFTLEFPRGGADTLGSEGAAIEIREELGESANRLEHLGTIHADTGLLSTPISVWVALMDASNLDNQHQEDITGLEPRWMQEGEFIGKVANGEVKCGLTLAAYTLFNINRGMFGTLLDNLF
ncbi:MAG: NUDIX hydrolase [Enterococcus sp.]|nr:NUDIX hydrolase [Enterococcus sp.]